MTKFFNRDGECIRGGLSSGGGNPIKLFWKLFLDVRVDDGEGVWFIGYRRSDGMCSVLDGFGMIYLETTREISRKHII